MSSPSKEWLVRFRMAACALSLLSLVGGCGDSDGSRKAPEVDSGMTGDGDGPAALDAGAATETKCTGERGCAGLQSCVGSQCTECACIADQTVPSWTVLTSGGELALAADGSIAVAQLGQTMTLAGLDPLVLATALGSAVVLAVLIQNPVTSVLFGSRPVGAVGWATAVGCATAATLGRGDQQCWRRALRGA